MNRERIKQLALESGFKLKEQPDGTVDLNPYVYEFAEQLISSATTAANEMNAAIKYQMDKSNKEIITLRSEIRAINNLLNEAIRARGEK